MNITKQQWTIIGVVVAIIAVWYFFLRKKKAEKTETGYGPMGGSYSHFGDETNFGVPGSGYGLNAMENGYRSSIVCPPGFQMVGGRCIKGTVAFPDMAARTAGTRCPVGQTWDEATKQCVDMSMSTSKVAPFGVAGASGRVSGIAGAGAGAGTGTGAGMTAADCMAACRAAGFPSGSCSRRCSGGGASTSM